jgi:REP element-mobilizing transposase RayT
VCKDEKYDEEKLAYLITWVTHNSRVSERMIKFNVKTGPALRLTIQQEVLITKIIKKIVKEDNLTLLAYNICVDHLHLILVCHEHNRDNIVRKLKGKASLFFHKGVHPLVGNPKPKYADGSRYHLWAQKYHYVELENTEDIENAKEYILDNRGKHGYSESKELQEIINSFLVDIEDVTWY